MNNMMFYNGTSVLLDSATGMGSLTAMWKACGAEERNKPANWLHTKEVQEFIQELSKSVNLHLSSDVTSEDLVITRSGNQGGTWAHWQIATKVE
jgi:hypothetical protein